MNPDGFLADVERRPSTYLALADRLELGAPLPSAPTGPVLLLGMGSSRYAATTAARHLRHAGLNVVADYASSALGPNPHPNLTVLAISATGGSAETVAAVAPHLGRSRVIAVTNDPTSSFARSCDEVITVDAEPEVGGVACRTFSHTLAVLLHLASVWAGADVEVPRALRRAASATEVLLEDRESWLTGATELLAGPDGCWLLAPAARLASAEQGALMFREGPRRSAVACETGDWSHVDVYLTKSLDYRALLFAGSEWDEPALTWLRERKAKFVSVGGDWAGSTMTIRYPHDEDPIVALLTEVVVPELVAHRLWISS